LRFKRTKLQNRINIRLTEENAADAKKHKKLANEQNLIKNSERTPKQRKAQATAAGIASGIARREKKNLRERLLLCGEQMITSKDGTTLPREDVIALQVSQKAANGDLKAARLYAELTGQLTQKVEVDTAPPIVILPHEKKR
jgi:hypothetical protein